MDYVEGFVAAVPNDSKDAYIRYSAEAAAVFKEYGAKRMVECWADDVQSEGVTSFPQAVQCREDETVVFSWIIWPSRKIRDSGMEKFRTDPRITDPSNPPPFDGSRAIFGGFQVILEK